MREQFWWHLVTTDATDEELRHVAQYGYGKPQQKAAEMLALRKKKGIQR